jgi:hypothetical protein
VNKSDYFNLTVSESGDIGEHIIHENDGRTKAYRGMTHDINDKEIKIAGERIVIIAWQLQSTM